MIRDLLIAAGLIGLLAAMSELWRLNALGRLLGIIALGGAAYIVNLVLL